MDPLKQESCVAAVSCNGELRAPVAPDLKPQEGGDHSEYIHLALTTTPAMLNNYS